MEIDKQIIKFLKWFVAITFWFSCYMCSVYRNGRSGPINVMLEISDVIVSSTDMIQTLTSSAFAALTLAEARVNNI
jgi:hypothetical protein